MDYHDPFGAPEIYVDGVAYREWAGPELLRVALFAREHGEGLVRVKLLIPVPVALQTHQDLHNFIQMQRRMN